MAQTVQTGFHDAYAYATVLRPPTDGPQPPIGGQWSGSNVVSLAHDDIKFTYQFQNFFHPFVGELIGHLNRFSLTGLLDANFHASLTDDFFARFYKPPDTPSDLVT